MNIWIIWLIVAGVLLIVEVLTQMMWALCLAVGCVAALIGSACGIPLIWQVVLLAGGAFASYVFLVPLFQRMHALSVDKKGKAVRTGMDALLGRRSVLSEEITPERPGRGRIDGDSWQMRSAEKGRTIRRGSEVVVTGYDSIILEVEPVAQK